MKLGSSLTLSAGVVLVIGLAGWLLTTWARRDGIAIGKQLEHDAGTDRVNAARAAAEIAGEVAYRHLLDSIGRPSPATRALPAQQHRADSAGAAIAALPDSLIPKSQALSALREKDSTIVLLKGVIAQDTVGIHARDGEILRLTRSVRSYADTVVPNLTRDRDWWKRRASSPCGLGGTVGLGIRGADAVAGFTCRIKLPFLP